MRLTVSARCGLDLVVIGGSTQILAFGDLGGDQDQCQCRSGDSSGALGWNVELQEVTLTKLVGGHKNECATNAYLSVKAEDPRHSAADQHHGALGGATESFWTNAPPATPPPKPATAACASSLSWKAP